MAEELERDPMAELEACKEAYREGLKAGYPDFLAEIKELQKEHAPKDKPRSYVNSQWQAEWKDFIKYDMDWDHGFLMDLILYKLQKMKAWFSRFGMTAEEERGKIAAEIEEAIRLYNYAQDTDFDDNVYTWANKHTYSWVEIHEGDCMHSGKLLYKTKEIRDDRKEELNFLKNQEADDWCKANGHKNYKDVHYSYCSRWDCFINKYIWKYKLRKAYKAEQKAFDDFFLYVSRHFRGWWD